METNDEAEHLERFNGLNRTMQYGNACGVQKREQGQKFKSHYVVWKHHFSEPLIINTFLFKSHYVVWKLFISILTKHNCFTFKSHYVVWKQHNLLKLSGAIYCLNRTMQYGNFSSFVVSSSEKGMFKSHYVVWKLFAHVSEYLTSISLNRTMQYGNSLC